MNKRVYTTALILILILVTNVYSKPRVNFLTNHNVGIYPSVIREQIRFDAKNIDTWVQNTGIFDLDIRTANTPGMMWPKGSNRFVVFSAGLSIGTYIEGQLRLATASYNGEYAPGYTQLVGGVPTPITNTDFKLYKVTSTDSTSADYLNWYKMIPYGAPYVDRNNNGQWDISIDRPGINNAAQTIFICMTDGFPENHTQSEGFSGGTLPIFSEIHLTAWAYDNNSYSDFQFINFVVINKNNKAWNNAYMGLFVDPDLGNSLDDYIGCDTTSNLGYCYNADNTDGSGNPPSYGINPPAVGMKYILSPVVPTGNPNDSVVFFDPPGSANRRVKKGVRELGMTSFVFIKGVPGAQIACEIDPVEPIEAYNYLSGSKKDGSSWFNPLTHQRAKKVCPGNPESGSGWTEFSGAIKNCLGGDTVNVHPDSPGERMFVMNTGRADLTVNPGDTQRIIITQMCARGTNNLNSITRLKIYSQYAQILYGTNFTVGVTEISSEVPEKYSLGQNYPNPFNPITNIKFSILNAGHVKIIVYDVMGREVQTVVNERLQMGTYEATFDGSMLNSGVYFYKMTSDNYSQTKRMVLIK